ncbi:hypothetical protein [Frankia sp. AgKG'84/4]|uniref:hypothetical protein n=1 Tax=Frankia sp. AgKG'84/4 TaxID=573490 RepID=UPI00200CE9EF|nr:hypothetical protein [Frankia sp. AgKG'84/4]MCL9793096.1 hypothetical protein [Frankia sp. AgKG'84/4]
MPSTPSTGWVPDLSVFPRLPDIEFPPGAADALASQAGPEPALVDVVAALASEGDRVPPIAWVPGTEATAELTWSGRVTRLRIGLHAGIDDAAGEIIRASRGHETRDRICWSLAAATYPVALLVLEALRRREVVAAWPALGIFVGVLAVACVVARLYSRRLERRVMADVLRLVPIHQPGDRRDVPLLDVADIELAHRT